MFFNRSKRGGWADALCPIGAADKRVLGGSHHFRRADDGRNGEPIANALGEDGEVGIHTVEQVDATGIQAHCGRDLIENQYRTNVAGNLAHFLEKPRQRFFTTLHFANNRSKFSTMFGY